MTYAFNVDILRLYGSVSMRAVTKGDQGAADGRRWVSLWREPGSLIRWVMCWCGRTEMVPYAVSCLIDGIAKTLNARGRADRGSRRHHHAPSKPQQRSLGRVVLKGEKAANFVLLHIKPVHFLTYHLPPTKAATLLIHVEPQKRLTHFETLRTPANMDSSKITQQPEKGTNQPVSLSGLEYYLANA